VSPVKYELVSYIPEDGILHNHRRENLKSYISKHVLAATNANNNRETVRRLAVPASRDRLIRVDVT
jgi:hypothetical protein